MANRTDGVKVARDGQPCPNTHDPDCRWPECNCRTTGVLAAPAPRTVREFTNELGNRIRITIEGPTSTSENVLTPMEVGELQQALVAHGSNTTPVVDQKAANLSDNAAGMEGRKP